MDLPRKESDLWVRNLKIEWLMPTSFSSFCLFLSFPSQKTELGAATAMDRNNYVKVGYGQNAPT